MWFLVCALRGPAAADTLFPDLRDPPTFVSQSKILTATLTAATRDVTIGAVTIPGLLYNGVYAGPVLRAHPGDRLLVRLVNRLSEPTNLHFHGLHTSPLGNGDNVHVVVAPGDSFLYSISIPESQPPGLYWYHAHLHGISERQVMSGLSGALIVEGFAGQFPALEGITERLFVLKEHDFDDTDDPVIDGQLHERLLTINGQAGVTISMRPHETQLWRLGNVSANYILHLALPGHRFNIIGEDGVAREAGKPVDVLDIEPGSRLEVLVDAGNPGVSDLTANGVLTGSARFRVLGRVVVAGEDARTTIPPDVFPQQADLRMVQIDTARTISFTQDSDAEKYFINGKLFDHDRIDIRVPLGSTEEWTIRNDTDDFHEFHIHQVHFQVVAVNGRPVDFEGYRDVVRVPERGSVTLRMAFTDRRILGTFVYHCHVLKHEDRGMMGNIEVYDPAAQPQKAFLPEIFLRLRHAFTGEQFNLPYSYCGL